MSWQSTHRDEVDIQDWKVWASDYWDSQGQANGWSLDREGDLWSWHVYGSKGTENGTAATEEEARLQIHNATERLR